MDRPSRPAAPYTFVVLAIAILLMAPIVIRRTPSDIFPSIDIPVVSTIWNYTGLSAPEMTNRIVSGYERAVTTTVNDIEHIESQTLAGISVVKVFFQPKARIDAAVSQVTAIAQTVLRTMPPGTTPPLVTRRRPPRRRPHGPRPADGPTRRPVRTRSPFFAAFSAAPGAGRARKLLPRSGSQGLRAWHGTCSLLRRRVFRLS